MDIVLSPEMPLREAHDIGESLQIKIEALKGVERCYLGSPMEPEREGRRVARQATGCSVDSFYKTTMIDGAKQRTMKFSSERANTHSLCVCVCVSSVFHYKVCGLLDSETCYMRSCP